MKHVIFQFKTIYPVENFINDKFMVELNSDSINYNDLIAFFNNKINTQPDSINEHILFIFNNERFDDTKTYELENDVNIIQLVLKKDGDGIEQKLRVLFNIYGFDASELQFNRQNLDNLKMEFRQKLNIEKLKSIQQIRNNLINEQKIEKEEDDEDNENIFNNDNEFIRNFKNRFSRFNIEDNNNNEMFNHNMRMRHHKPMIEEDDDEDEEINKPLPQEEIKFTEEIIDEQNKKTIELFKNENFRNLMRIFNDEPDIFKTFASYITHGDVCLDAFDNDNNDNDYSNELEHIKSLNIDIDDELILETLKRFNGHMNLSLRYLLTK